MDYLNPRGHRTGPCPPTVASPCPDGLLHSIGWANHLRDRGELVQPIRCRWCGEQMRWTQRGRQTPGKPASWRGVFICAACDRPPANTPRLVSRNDPRLEE